MSILLNSDIKYSIHSWCSWVPGILFPISSVWFFIEIYAYSPLKDSSISIFLIEFWGVVKTVLKSIIKISPEIKKDTNKIVWLFFFIINHL